MKKTIFILTLILCSILSVSANTDWEEGYLKGYEDALAGLPNKVELEKSSNEVANNNWELLYYVDSFGDQTDKGYITQINISQGTFSNSATQNSLLLWFFLIDNEDVALKLLEYGSSPATGYGSRSHKLSVKESDGTVTDFICNSGSDRIYIQSTFVPKFIEILKKEKKIKLYVQDIDYFNSSYNLGEFECTGFNNIYETMLKGYNK